MTKYCTQVLFADNGVGRTIVHTSVPLTRHIALVYVQLGILLSYKSRHILNILTAKYNLIYVCIYSTSRPAHVCLGLTLQKKKIKNKKKIAPEMVPDTSKP